MKKSTFFYTTNVVNILFSLVFEYNLLYYGPIFGQLSLGTGQMINTSPNGVTVDYECWYLTTVSVDSANFDVEPITIIGEKSNTGNLANGFTLTVGPSPIILGKVVDVTTTWDVAIQCGKWGRGKTGERGENF